MVIRLFDMSKRRVHQAVERAAIAVGLVKPEGVGTVHILRHSGAIARLRASGNPRSVQAQLGHLNTAMTLGGSPHKIGP